MATDSPSQCWGLQCHVGDFRGIPQSGHAAAAAILCRTRAYYLLIPTHVLVTCYKRVYVRESSLLDLAVRGIWDPSGRYACSRCCNIALYLTPGYTSVSGSAILMIGCVVGLLVSARIGAGAGSGGAPRTVRSQQLLFYRIISDPMIYSHEWVCYLDHWVRGWATRISRDRGWGRGSGGPAYGTLATVAVLSHYI